MNRATHNVQAVHAHCPSTLSVWSLPCCNSPKGVRLGGPAFPRIPFSEGGTGLSSPASRMERPNFLNVSITSSSSSVSVSPSSDTKINAGSVLPFFAGDPSPVQKCVRCERVLNEVPPSSAAVLMSLNRSMSVSKGISTARSSSVSVVESSDSRSLTFCF
jgi:hypothetical protein